MQTACNYKYNIYRIIIITFIITALWDVVLRILSVYNPIPSVKAFFPFIQYLEPYFMQHTLLDAALIAGFVGATTQVIILYFMTLPTRNTSISDMVVYSQCSLWICNEGK